MSALIAVHACRSGTGKSSVMASLAIAIARRGRRVGVLDATQTLRVPVWTGLDEHGSDHETLVILDGVRLNGAGLNGTGTLTAADDSGGQWEQGRLLEQTPKDWHRGLLEMGDRLQLDCLLIETPTGLEEAALLWLAIADLFLSVLCLSPQDYQKTAVLVDLSKQLVIPHLGLLANQVPACYSLQRVREQLQTTYGCAIVGALPATRDLLSMDNLALCGRHHPTHPWNLAVEAIAQQMMETLKWEVPRATLNLPASAGEMPQTAIL